MNLSEVQVIEGYSKNQTNDSFWFLAYIGQQFFKNNKLYTALWLVSIENSTYQFNEDCSNWLRIDVLSHNVNSYKVGSIYNNKGKLIKSYRRSVDELQSTGTSFSAKDDLLTMGLFSHLSKTDYPIPPYEYGVLKGFPYYLKEITIAETKKVKIIVPNHVFINYFFWITLQV